MHSSTMSKTAINNADRYNASNLFYVTLRSTFDINAIHFISTPTSIKTHNIVFFERPSRCVLSNLYNKLRTVDTQHTSRQDAIITIRLYLATCFGR